MNNTQTVIIMTMILMSGIFFSVVIGYWYTSRPTIESIHITLLEFISSILITSLPFIGSLVIIYIWNTLCEKKQCSKYYECEDN